MKVTNINNTSGRTCFCDNWFAHWGKFSGRTGAAPCSTQMCYNQAMVGAHVQKDSAWDRNWYIIPLCANCNAQRGASLEIRDDVPLISANVEETCGKLRFI
jgi:hypothetical protein